MRKTICVQAVGFAALSVVLATPAVAAWQQAQSKHFIIYSNEKPERLQAFATKLEKFDSAVREVRAMRDPAVGDGNRLTVFVLADDVAVRKMMGDKTGFVAGYYHPSASGSIAVVPHDTGAMSADDLPADTVFFHEYAHHLMMQALDRPLPDWLIEGFAEFLSTARFPKDGSVVLGAAAVHRQWGLYERDDGLTLKQLLEGKYSKINESERESIYALGWLMVHYLTFDPDRQGQLATYVDKIAAGLAPLDAAGAAFGDLRKLQSDALRYMNRATLKALIVPPERLGTPSVSVRPLSHGAAKVILVRARSRTGVDKKSAQLVVAEARAIAAQYPGDELVETELAEAEIDGGHASEAKAAADRALAANPRNTDAMVLKGRAILALAKDSPDPDRMIGEARRIFIAANKVDTEDPDPLYNFYLSYVQEGKAPTANAIAALHYASDLVPQDDTLRINSAYVYLRNGELPAAKRALVPVAYDPHGGDSSDMAKAMISAIDKGDSKAAIAVMEKTSSDGD